jgi:hypothetical protein
MACSQFRRAALGGGAMLLVACASLDQPPAATDSGESMLAGDVAKRCARENAPIDAELAREVSAGNVDVDCMGDDGECQASVPCTGKLEDRECDPGRFISAQAAACIASGQGLAPGLHGLTTALSYSFGQRRVTWNVTNTLEESGGGASGQVFVIDAVTGELVDELGWRSTP